MSLPSGLTVDVADGEPIARFARHRDYKKSTLQPKGDMFIPPRNSSDLSVSRVGTLSIRAVKELGHHVIEQVPGHTLKGWCIMEAKVIRSVRSFKLVSDEPDDHHHYHAHVSGFPLDKSEQMEAADDLAEVAGLVTVVSN